MSFMVKKLINLWAATALYEIKVFCQSALQSFHCINIYGKSTWDIKKRATNNYLIVANGITLPLPHNILNACTLVIDAE